ncbi:MAG: molybdate ABC transporter substrate-binding protein [Sphaerospermopsis sp. SIO1G2]|nr:molybdate ABC transporter substrate-binding protein [Sphaerospermopsis sp. SIO1G1]NET70753.1 molybdate ABC transporter substrate-binding protein [Sphaerospermopsis sp. SIO1G2]
MQKDFINTLFSAKRRKFLGLIATAIIAMLVVIGLQTINSNLVVGQSNTNLLISVASSMKDVMAEIKPLYEKSQSNISINYNFGASGALQRQIEQGAPVDVFIPAAKTQLDGLEAKNLLIPGSQAVIARNRLVLVVANNVSGMGSFDNLSDRKVRKIAIGEPRSVPAGQYAQQVLKELNLWNKLKSKFVYAKNVRQVLASVESGNADAGLVYATDAKISNQVKVAIAANETNHSPIIYPLAIIKRSKKIDASENFIQFLSSEAATAVFKKFGFILP